MTPKGVVFSFRRRRHAHRRHSTPRDSRLDDDWWTCDARERDGVGRRADGDDERERQGDDDATRGDPARGGGLPRRLRRRQDGRRRPHASRRPRGSREGSGAQIRRHGQTKRAQGECDDDDDDAFTI